MDTVRAGIRRFYCDPLPGLALQGKVPLFVVGARRRGQLGGRIEPNDQFLRLIAGQIAQRRNEAVRERIVEGVERRHGSIQRGKPLVGELIHHVAVGTFVELEVGWQEVDAAARTNDGLVVETVGEAKARSEETILLFPEALERMLRGIDELERTLDGLAVHLDPQLIEDRIDHAGVEGCSAVVALRVDTWDFPAKTGSNGQLVAYLPRVLGVVALIAQTLPGKCEGGHAARVTIPEQHRGQPAAAGPGANAVLGGEVIGESKVTTSGRLVVVVLHIANIGTELECVATAHPTDRRKQNIVVIDRKDLRVVVARLTGQIGIVADTVAGNRCFVGNTTESREFPVKVGRQAERLLHVDAGEGLDAEIVPAPVRSPNVNDDGGGRQPGGTRDRIARHKGLRGVGVATVDTISERIKGSVGGIPPGVPPEEAELIGVVPVKAASHLIVIAAGHRILGVVRDGRIRLTELIRIRKDWEGQHLLRDRIYAARRNRIVGELLPLNSSASSAGGVAVLTALGQGIINRNNGTGGILPACEIATIHSRKGN